MTVDVTALDARTDLYCVCIRKVILREAKSRASFRAVRSVRLAYEPA